MASGTWPGLARLTGERQLSKKYTPSWQNSDFKYPLIKIMFVFEYQPKIVKWRVQTNAIVFFFSKMKPMLGRPGLAWPIGFPVLGFAVYLAIYFRRCKQPAFSAVPTFFFIARTWGGTRSRRLKEIGIIEQSAPHVAQHAPERNVMFSKITFGKTRTSTGSRKPVEFTRWAR